MCPDKLSSPHLHTSTHTLLVTSFTSSLNLCIIKKARGVAIHRYESVPGWINTDATTSIRGPLNPSMHRMHVAIG